MTLVNFIEPPKPPPPPPPPPPEPPKVLQTHIIEQPRPTPVPPPPEEPPITYTDPAPMAVQAPPPAPAAPTIETDYSGTVDVTARSLNPPKYPADEQRRGITGVVTMLLTYDVTGAVTDVVVSKSSGNRNLDRAAVQAAHRWKVNPGSRGGQKMAGQVTASLNFTL